ncbi:MAG: site-specific DNA-methyltransferase [Blastocatellia bacterium]|nr:site-specific DNA-methyltransferase [Blastocatellia bacterium]
MSRFVNRDVNIATNVTLHLGDALTVARTLETESVQSIVTSPPYWGLRDYGTAKWEGGNPDCEHTISHWNDSLKPNVSRPFRGDRSSCLKCGAIRVDSQLGLERTPEEYVCHLVELFRELRRVLKDNGTAWINIGDSYASAFACARRSTIGAGSPDASVDRPNRLVGGLKEKDLIGIPWLVAFALRADGWYLRSDIIWHKPNPMPERVTARQTKSHEYIFLLSKSAQYYYDSDAVREQANYPGDDRKARAKEHHKSMPDGLRNGLRPGNYTYDLNTRNKRSVWTVNTHSFDEAHFATFPPKLITPCILAGAPVGGVVLDPFLGSGTTGLVSVKLQRSFVGIELNEQYFKMSERRIREAQLQIPMAMEYA